MPRKRTTCAHAGPRRILQDSRGHGAAGEYSRAHPHRESQESRKKSSRKYRIASYGLTQEQFGLILAAQNSACAMCHEPFEEGNFIHADHDHACCGKKNRSSGRRVEPGSGRW